MRKTVEEKLLREVIVKISLEKADMQKRIIIEVLLDSRVIELVMSSGFVRKQGFKLKRIEISIYMRNMDRLSNKKELIEYSRDQYLLSRV